MEILAVQGKAALRGELKIQGSKNAVLPMLAASLLHKGVTELTNVPRIWDVFCMIHILEELGAKVTFQGHCLRVDASFADGVRVSKEYGGKSRSSVLMLGALLARNREACLGLPGGCSIGERPVDLHQRAMEALGAETYVEEDMICAAAKNGLTGAVIRFPFPSVGATENALLAAVGAEGTSLLCGCAREPEIRDLCYFLKNMGAGIEGIGSSRLIVRGGMPLHDSSFAVNGDRIAAGTCLAAVAAAGGDICLNGVEAKDLIGMWEAFLRMGCRLKAEPGRILCSADERPAAIEELVTAPYPGFPTDMQSLFLAALCRGKGVSRVRETIFENRFEIVPELCRMGACIGEEDGLVKVVGQEKLSGAYVEAKDLRGGAALAVAALGAEGETRIAGLSHIRRGYEDLPGDLAGLGVKARVIQEEKHDEKRKEIQG
ncbi:MAG: UDP-N-acetylglucosamine 1-carboxyvinyltransferase [Lachnospiraceae bacterium]|nr:UDP-N-acetylglucosamine 1-carboxyvinyltransferase [Lachnospiraceae bacterium]